MPKSGTSAEEEEEEEEENEAEEQEDGGVRGVVVAEEKREDAAQSDDRPSGPRNTALLARASIGTVAIFEKPILLVKAQNQ